MGLGLPLTTTKRGDSQAHKARQSLAVAVLFAVRPYRLFSPPTSDRILKDKSGVIV